MPSVIQVEPRQLGDEIASGASILLLDVRNPEEFAAGHITGPSVRAANIPYYHFLADMQMSLARVPRHGPITVVCSKGGASRWVCELLAASGFSVRNLAGGMDAWNALFPG